MSADLKHPPGAHNCRILNCLGQQAFDEMAALTRERDALRAVANAARKFVQIDGVAYDLIQEGTNKFIQCLDCGKHKSLNANDKIQHAANCDVARLEDTLATLNRAGGGIGAAT